MPLHNRGFLLSGSGLPTNRAHVSRVWSGRNTDIALELILYLVLYNVIFEI